MTKPILQKGNVLIFSLALLGIVSVMTITMSQAVVGYTKISSAYKDGSDALSDAQLSTYYAELFIEDLTDVHTDQLDENYLSNSSSFDPETYDWAALLPTDRASGAIQSGHMIVYMDTITILGESIAEGGAAMAGSQAQYFDIYSYAKTQMQSNRLLQIVYARQL